MRWNLVLLWLLSGGALASAQDLAPPLVFHAAFDGALDAVARGTGSPVRVEGPVSFRPGKFNQALLCGDGGASVTYSAAQHLRASGGTVEMWVCPLDWTGAEEEFHVFLEAIDPGWLVFYRYYQGGILTLLGTDGQHYRAAAGPAFHFQPGQWHHLAGTWRAKRLEVFVDGQRVGVLENPVLPAQLPDTFVVGDRPWHVPRQRQTLIDELKLYAAPLDDASIARAARGESVAYQPQMIVATAIDPDTGRLRVECDAAGFTGELGRVRRARVEVVARGGSAPVAQGDITAFTHDMGCCELPIGDLASGDYDIRAMLLSDAGAEVARSTVPLHKPGPPVWSGSSLGMDDKVLAPWEPLQTDAAMRAVECWGRRYEFGTLLSRVQSADADMLSQGVRVEAVFGDHTATLTGPPCRLEQATDTRAVLVGQAEAEGLRMRVRHVVEFDGFTWTDVTIEPVEPGRRVQTQAGDVQLDLKIEPISPMQLEELRLTWTMPQAEATLLHADAMRWAGNPAGRLEPQGWASSLVPCFWLGNEQRGLAWYTESDLHWRAAKNKPTIQVVPEGDQVRVIVRLIAEPTTISDRREYGFGMMATPVRPRPAAARRWRMTPGVRPTIDIVWPNDAMTWYGYPEPADAQAFAARVQTAHAESVQVVPYVNLNYMSAGAPEWQYFGARWADPARVVTPGDVAAMGYASMGTCPAVRDWQDFILYRINEMIDRYQIDGIYIDCWSPYACSAGSCARRDAAGTIHPTWPIRAYREMLRRVYTLFRQKRPHPLLMVHMSSEVVIPMLSFTDTILDGEQFGGEALQDDYIDILPPAKFRAEFMGRNWGPVAFFLPEFRGPHAATGTPNLAAYLLLHDVNAWPIWSDAATWNRLYEALDRCDVSLARFLPYWQDNGVQAAPQVLTSCYAGSTGVILAVMNTGEATEAQLTLDLERLGLDGVSSALDILRNEPVTVAGNTLAVSLERHQGRAILLMSLKPEKP